MSPDETQKLQAEIQRALKPIGPYTRVDSVQKVIDALDICNAVVRRYGYSHRAQVVPNPTGGFAIAMITGNDVDRSFSVWGDIE